MILQELNGILISKNSFLSCLSFSPTFAAYLVLRSVFLDTDVDNVTTDAGAKTLQHYAFTKTSVRSFLRHTASSFHIFPGGLGKLFSRSAASIRCFNVLNSSTEGVILSYEVILPSFFLLFLAAASR